MITALVEMGMSESVYEAWLEHSPDSHDVPGYDVLIEFLE